jgi:LysM repeat protein
MRWRVFLGLSLAANVALGAAWMVTHHRLVRRSVALPPAEAAPTIKTNDVIRRQFFSWREIESEDYPTYIANLRAIDCPEQTIRDIIIADVNALYAHHLATDILTPDQQWWRTDPDASVVRAAFDGMRKLDQDRRALLAHLLGPDWESRDLASLPRPTRPGLALDGPVLGPLPDSVKQAVQDINSRSQERIQAYLDAQRSAGQPPDPAVLAKLREQTRRDLASVLSPAPLEEFLLRYSQDANDLRGDLRQLKYFNATPDEFRAMFRATDQLDAQLAALSGDDPNTASLRQALQQQRNDALKSALGADRYLQYQLLHDPLFRDATAAAQAAGTPDAAATLYQINLAALQQQNTVQANTNLTSEQRVAELARLQLDKLTANAQALGQIPPPTPPPPPPPQPTVHIIANGDSLLSLANRYGVPPAAIVAANMNVDIYHLKAGDPLQIPVPPPTPSQ